MRKHRKNRWENVRTYLLIELIAAVMAVLMAATVYYSNRATVLADVEYRMNQFEQHWFRSSIFGDEDKLEWLRNMFYELYCDSDFRDCTAISIHCEYARGEGWYGRSEFTGGGLYLDGAFVYLDAAYWEDSEPYSDDRIVRERFWDLKKCFSKGDIDALVDFIPKDYTGMDDRTQYELEEVRGRETDDGQYLITRMIVSKEGDMLVLKSPEFQETDEDFPTLYRYRASDNRNGRVSLHLNVMAQNPALGSLVNTYRVDEEARGKCYWRVFYHSDPLLNSQYEISRRIEDLRAGESGEISYRIDDHAANSAEMYVLIDYAKITWIRSYRRMLEVSVLFQGYAILAMLLVSYTRRKKEERRQLHATFVNAMAHELKTPAAVVRNTAEYLATGAKPEKQDHYINVLMRESEAMDTLLNRMFTYTRVLDGNVDFKPGWTNLSLLTEDALAPYGDLIAEKGMTVNRSLQSAALTYCDPALMSMVIDNLISNAVRYGEPGSRIIIRLSETEFSVWNKAEAFSEEELASVWTPMFVSERRAKDSETGGMGLAISAGILKRHGFAYGVSNEDDGVLFRIKLTETKESDKQKWDDPDNNRAVWGALCFSLIPLCSAIADDDWPELVLVGIWMAFCIFVMLIRTEKIKRKQRKND